MRLSIRDWINTLLDERPRSSDCCSSETPEPVSTSLYACQSCDSTYIAAELRSCPECGDAVENVPTASELGYDSAER